MTLRVVVVVEASLDAEVATRLLDRVALENIDWLSSTLLNEYRKFTGLLPDSGWLTWTAAKREARARNIPFHGYFDGTEAKLYAVETQRAIRLVKAAVPEG